MKDKNNQGTTERKCEQIPLRGMQKNFSQDNGFLGW